MMNRYRNFLRAGFLALASVLVAGCQGGGANPPPFPSGNPNASGQLTVSPSSLNFSGTGSTYAQTVTVTVTAPTSILNVTPDAACGTGSNAIVSISNATQNGNTFTATVTPQRAGSCNVVVSSPQGGSQTVPITVNTGSVTISRRR
jgi:hypothetical protein